MAKVSAETQEYYINAIFKVCDSYLDRDKPIPETDLAMARQSINIARSAGHVDVADRCDKIFKEKYLK